jgi:hypothetical protein
MKPPPGGSKTRARAITCSLKPVADFDIGPAAVSTMTVKLPETYVKTEIPMMLSRGNHDASSEMHMPLDPAVIAEVGTESGLGA